MRKNVLCLSVLACCFTNSVFANWQYPGVYMGDGWYEDDGARLVLSFRGGASMTMGDIKNELGDMTASYYENGTTGEIVPGLYYTYQANYTFAGSGNLGDLKAAKNMKEYSFAGGASIGYVLGGNPSWRLEAGWDHVSETNYNVAPLFVGDFGFGEVESAGVQSSMTTDVFSAMAFYDFFDGYKKAANSVTPYIGFGLGYANIKTVLNLSDLYGDLSESVELTNYGTANAYAYAYEVLEFEQSDVDENSIVALGSVGLAYAISDNVLLDVGVRAMYVPKVKWSLTSIDGGKHRAVFSSENTIYANLMLGLRFEF